jgi:hypothetical protein
MWYMEHDVAGRDESSESSAVHDVIVCYDSFNSLPTCRRTDRRQIAPDFPIPIFSAYVSASRTSYKIGFAHRGLDKADGNT